METAKAISTTIITLLVVSVIGFGLWWLVKDQGLSGMPNSYSNIQNSVPQNNVPKEKGKLTISVTDAAASMKNISKVELAASKVQLYSSIQGWVTLPAPQKTFDLLALKSSGKFQEFITTDIPEDTYTQVRMQLDRVTVTETGGTVKIAHLPTPTMKFNSVVKVEKDQSSSLSIDFLADKSLYTTSDKGYVFAPVIAIESKSQANVQVDSSAYVTTTQGNVDTKTQMGMDLNGEMKMDFVLSAQSDLEIVGGKVQIKGTGKGSETVSPGLLP